MSRISFIQSDLEIENIVSSIDVGSDLMGVLYHSLYHTFKESDCDGKIYYIDFIE